MERRCVQNLSSSWMLLVVCLSGATRDTAEEKGGEESCSECCEEIQKRQRGEAIIFETRRWWNGRRSLSCCYCWGRERGRWQQWWEGRKQEEGWTKREIKETSTKGIKQICHMLNDVYWTEGVPLWGSIKPIIKSKEYNIKILIAWHTIVSFCTYNVYVENIMLIYMASLLNFCWFRMLSLAMVERRSGWRVTRLSHRQTCPSSVPASTARHLRDLEGRVLRAARDLVVWGQRVNRKLNAWGRVEDKRWNWKDSEWRSQAIKSLHNIIAMYTMP